ELSKDGRSIGATTSSAEGRSSASRRGWGKSFSGSMWSRIRSRSWSTVATRSPIRQLRLGRDPLRGLGRQRHVADHPHPVPEGPVSLDGQGLGLLQRRRTFGAPLVELAHTLVVLAVEVDERYVVGGLVEHEVAADVVDVGA